MSANERPRQGVTSEMVVFAVLALLNTAGLVAGAVADVRGVLIGAGLVGVLLCCGAMLWLVVEQAEISGDTPPDPHATERPEGS